MSAGKRDRESTRRYDLRQLLPQRLAPYSPLPKNCLELVITCTGGPYLPQDWIGQVKGVQALGLGGCDPLPQGLQKPARPPSLFLLAVPQLYLLPATSYTVDWIAGMHAG